MFLMGGTRVSDGLGGVWKLHGANLYVGPLQPYTQLHISPNRQHYTDNTSRPIHSASPILMRDISENSPYCLIYATIAL